MFSCGDFIKLKQNLVIPEAFIQTLLSTAIFLQRFSFFIVCLVNYLCEVLPWWATKESFLKFKSPDYWKMHSWHHFWLQKHSLYIVCMQWQQMFLRLQSFMVSFMRLSFITQFKTEFLLLFTSCRKVLGKIPGYCIYRLKLIFHVYYILWVFLLHYLHHLKNKTNHLYRHCNVCIK